MKKFFSVFLCLFLFLSCSSADKAWAAAEWPSGISISADGGIVMDVNSGAVLYGKNINESYYPASITKILTALIIIENCDLEDTVTFSHTAVNTLEPGATILGARTRDQLSVRDCLYALLLQSANEVANALAEHCSGSIEAFAELMNRKAESLGCTNSHFANPSGLNNENHYTSAYDMALISQAAFENPTFVEIDSTTYYDVPAGQLQQYPNGWRYYAHHRMLKKNDSVYYNGIIGGKTGYTSLAGNTLVTCAERDGLKLVAVVLNGHQTHYTDTRTLLDFGFQNFKSIAIADKDSTYQKIENDLTISGIIPGESTRLSIDKGSVITLPNGGDFSDVTSSLDYNLKGSAPDTAVARIDYMYGDKKVGQAFLEANTIPGFTPGTIEALESSGDSGAVATIEVTAKATETPDPAQMDQLEENPISNSPKKVSFVFSILKKVLFVIAVLAVIGALVFGILSYREYRVQKELSLRRERRESRLKRWGYSVTEFDTIMEEHLRYKNKYKKRSFWDRLRRR